MNRIESDAVPSAVSVASESTHRSPPSESSTPGSIVSVAPELTVTVLTTLYGLPASVHVVFVVIVPETSVCAWAAGHRVSTAARARQQGAMRIGSSRSSGESSVS